MAGLSSFNIDIWIALSQRGQFDVLDLISLQRVNKTLRLLLSEDSVSASALWHEALKHSSEFSSISGIQGPVYHQVCNVGKSMAQGIALAHRLRRVQSIFYCGFPRSSSADTYEMLQPYQRLPEVVRHFLAHSGFYEYQEPTETAIYVVLIEYEVKILLDGPPPSYSVQYEENTFESLESFLDLVEHCAEEALELRSPNRLRPLTNWIHQCEMIRAETHPIFREKKLFESLCANDLAKVPLRVRQIPSLLNYALYYCCRSKLPHLVMDLIPLGSGKLIHNESMQLALVDLVVYGVVSPKQFLLQNRFLSGSTLASILCFLIYKGQGTRFEDALELQLGCLSSGVDLKQVFEAALFHLLRTCDSPFDASGNLIYQSSMTSVLIKFLQTHREALARHVGESRPDILFYSMKYGSKVYKSILRFIFGQELSLSIVAAALGSREDDLDVSAVCAAMDTFNLTLNDISTQRLFLKTTLPTLTP